MEVIVQRQGALDVHKAQVTACVRVPDQDGARVQLVEQFATTVPGLLVLGDWLRSHRVTHVVMEATWRLLEARLAHARRGLRADARQRAARQERPRTQDRRW